MPVRGRRTLSMMKSKCGVLAWSRWPLLVETVSCMSHHEYKSAWEWYLHCFLSSFKNNVSLPLSSLFLTIDYVSPISLTKRTLLMAWVSQYTGLTLYYKPNICSLCKFCQWTWETHGQKWLSLSGFQCGWFPDRELTITFHYCFPLRFFTDQKHTSKCVSLCLGVFCVILASALIALSSYGK